MKRFLFNRLLNLENEKDGGQCPPYINFYTVPIFEIMPMIRLPYGNNEFNSDELKEYISRTGRNYIIQGQTNCRRDNHPKPSSLDCWLRDNYAENHDTKQAVNEVISALIDTGEFEEGRFICPDSGKPCKGIRIVEKM